MRIIQVARQARDIDQINSKSGLEGLNNNGAKANSRFGGISRHWRPLYLVAMLRFNARNHKRHNTSAARGSAMEFNNVTEFVEVLSDDAVRIASESFELHLAYGTDSLHTVDEILLAFHENLADLDEDSIGALASSFGGYAGECIRRAHPEVRWPEDFHEDGLGHITLDWNGWQAPVFGIAYERITNGSEEGVWHMYEMLKEMANAPRPASPDISPKPSHDPIPGHPLSPEESEIVRQSSMSIVTAQGLQAATWLPMPNARGPQQLRPAEEIARRLMGLHATVAWCCAPEELLPSDLLVQYVDGQDLFEIVSERERDLLNLERPQAAKQSERVGWYTENMWALSWVLGLDQTPGIDGQMIPDDIGPAMADGLLKGFSATVEEVATTFGLRPFAEVVQFEDIFYCAHTAFRSLALKDQNMIFPCGVVQERRHALTWALSPGVAWDETDLST